MTTKPIFEVKFTATGQCVGRLRNEVTLTAHAPFQSQNMLATDEGAGQGGDGTAPTPLEYFLTGLVGCLMTQIRVFSRRMKVPFEDMAVSCAADWAGVADADAPYRGVPVGFSIDIDIQAAPDTDPERIDALIDAARKGCFVEQTLAHANTVTHRRRINAGAWSDI